MLTPNPHWWLLRYHRWPTFTDGLEILALRGSKPAKIVAIESVGGSQALRVLGFKLAGPTRRIGSWEQLRGWPPDRPALGPLEDAIGATILPRSQTDRHIGYELLVGYTITDRSKIAIRTGLEVTYTVGGKQYVYRAPAGIVFCPTGQTDETCLAAARDAMT